MTLPPQTPMSDLQSPSREEKQEWFHQSAVIACFAQGIIGADRFYWGYRLPEGFQIVVDDFSRALQAEYGKNEMFKQGLERVYAFVRSFTHNHTVCKEWNALPGNQFVTRYDAVRDIPEFIDLDAIALNTRNNLRLYLRS